MAGLVGCVVLVATLPIESVAAGVGMFAVGLGARLAVRSGALPRRRAEA